MNYSQNIYFSLQSRLYGVHYNYTAFKQILHTFLVECSRCGRQLRHRIILNGLNGLKHLLRSVTFSSESGNRVKRSYIKQVRCLVDEICCVFGIKCLHQDTIVRWCITVVQNPQGRSLVINMFIKWNFI